MKARTDFPSNRYNTKIQWAQLGKAVNADAQSVELWIDRWHTNSAFFYAAEDVHDGSKEELDEVLAPLRESIEKSRAAHKMRQEELREVRKQKMIAEAEQRVVTKILSLLAEKMLHAEPQAQAIVIDTETTGLTAGDELLQISIIDDAGTVLLDSLVRPYMHEEWPEAQAINGITPEMVADAPYPHELLPILVEIFSEVSTCIGYNLQFDLGFLRRIGVPIDHLQQVDVMQMFVDYRNTRYNSSYKRLSLATCTKHFHYRWDGTAHNSLADAKATLYCYNMLKAQFSEPDNNEKYE